MRDSSEFASEQAHLLRDMAPSTAEINYDDRDNDVFEDGTFKYAISHDHTGSGPTYQEASGAPVEATSPLGRHVGWMTAVFLNIGKMIGTGIFSTRWLTNTIHFARY